MKSCKSISIEKVPLGTEMENEKQIIKKTQMVKLIMH